MSGQGMRSEHGSFRRGPESAASTPRTALGAGFVRFARFIADAGLHWHHGEAKPGMGVRWYRCVLCLCTVCALPGCERAMHDMYEQPVYKSGASSPLFADDKAARRPPPGSIAAVSGELAGPSSGRLGRSLPAPASSLGGNPYPISLALLQRGQNRYDIDCAPCHGLTGEGNGMVVQRGFPRPLSYLDARLLHAPDAALEQTIAHGYGVMYPFGDRLDAHDRWAIVAYIRALQLSRRVPVERLAPEDRNALGRRGASSP